MRKFLRQPRASLTSARGKRAAVVLILLLLVAFWALRRYQSYVPLGPQQQVTTINAKVGVHTRLTDEVEEWKIKRTLEMVREMGAPWIVEYFPWAYVEESPGSYNWVHADQVVNHAARQGLQVVARLGFVPEWARPKDSSPLFLQYRSFDAFASFSAEFARRYAGKVHYIIVWNEPNLALEWGYTRPDARKYAALLAAVYPAIKAANPDVQVLAGALAPTLAPPGSDSGVNDLDFLQQMYDAGAAAHFDMLAIHAYGWTADPDEPAAPDVVNFRRSELLRAVMVRNGDEQKAAMITEGGWNDHPRWTRAVHPAQRIAYTIRAYEISQQEWPWLSAVCLWAFRYPWDAKSYQDYYTFVGTDFAPKPIYDEVQRYTAGMLDTDSR